MVCHTLKTCCDVNVANISRSDDTSHGLVNKNEVAIISWKQYVVMLLSCILMTFSICKTHVKRQCYSIQCHLLAHISPFNLAHIRPFNLAHIRPFNLAHIRPFNLAHIRPWNLAHIRPFNLAHIRPFKLAHIRPFNLAHFRPFNLANIRPC